MSAFGCRQTACEARDVLVRYPHFVVCTTLYWLWTGLMFQGPAFYVSADWELFTDMPSWLMPMGCYAVSFMGIGVCYKRVDAVMGTNVWLAVLAVVMTAGVTLCMLWLYAPLGVGARMTCYVLGTQAASFGAAGFLVTTSRFNGYVGPRCTLVVCMTSMMFAALAMGAFAYLPDIACQLFLLALPVLFSVNAVRVYKAIPRKQAAEVCDGAEPVKPKKLLLTAGLHGLPFGLSIVMMESVRLDSTMLLFNAACFTLGTIALFVVFSRTAFDFNQLVYLVGFPAMGLGLLFLAIVPANPLLGCAVVAVGYAFVHLVMCGVNAYLVKRFDISMPWILSWTTCCFMLGQAVGALTCGVALAAGVPVATVASCMCFVVLVASTLLVDNRNMKYGWGVVRPSVESPVDALSEGCQVLGAQCGLTKREVQILLYLAQGRSRKGISSELAIGEETVKSHVRSIYGKLDVHTKEELIGAVHRQAHRLEG